MFIRKFQLLNNANLMSISKT